MTDDRTLLEKAARAFWAGEIDDVVSIEWGEMDGCILYTHGDNQDHNGRDRTYRWNPLEENHDAFELASKLRILVDFSSCCAMSLRGPDDDWFGGLPDDERIGCSPDEFGGPKVTRRAIVRAAASLGSLDEEKQP